MTAEEHTGASLAALPTEQRNPALRWLETKSEAQLVRLIHRQDRQALAAVGRSQDQLARAVADLSAALGRGGRLIYLGAGTSGRLAALDAAECPPTFGTRPSQVVALVAGGARALRRAVEGAEDSRQQGRQAVRRLDAGAADLVCGVTASGRTPFVLAGLAEARRRGCTTLLVTCAAAQQVRGLAQRIIALDVGPETVAGSTRMKAGLATKAVLHTLTTAAMVRQGKVYDNMMVDLRPTSSKLRARAVRMVALLSGRGEAAAARLLQQAGQRPKVALVMAHRGVGRRRAQELLRRVGGRLRDVIGEVTP